MQTTRGKQDEAASVPWRRRSSRLTGWLRTCYGGQTWREAVYALTGLPLAVIGFVCTMLPLALGISLVLVYAGFPIVAGQLAVGRAFGDLARRRAKWLLGVDIQQPVAPRSRMDRTGWLRAGLTDADAWRAVLYIAIDLPLSALGFSVATLLWGCGFAWLSYPFWFSAAPLVVNNIQLGTWPLVLLVTAAGLAVLVLAPWLVRVTVQLNQLAARALLAPSRTAQRLRDLETTRSHAVTESSEMLRRIERDLHDGAQARMVAIAIDLGVAKEILASRPDDDPARELVDLAHTNANTAIAELRDLTRGIHPPALDHGLDTALTTLGARAPIPVDVRVDLPNRPDRAIETIVYFCAAELLVNVVKHSHAEQVRLELTQDGQTIRLRTVDNGAGGAVVTDGGGLAGLRERVRTVDGSLTVTSPAGGPTTILVELPTRA